MNPNDSQHARDRAELYKASPINPRLFTVPPLRFLMIDGVGGVGENHFRAAMEALYTLAYQVKFATKKRVGLGYKVSPAEGLYWDADGLPADPPTTPERTAWRLMSAIPDVVNGDLVDEVRDAAAAKKGLPLLDEIRLQTFSEGESVQMLHVGPHTEATSAMATLTSFAREQGLGLSGVHHEIYLSDPNRTAPGKMKTIIRLAVRRGR